MIQKIWKSLGISAIISLLICIVGCAVNYLSFQKTGHFPLAYRIYGGEYMNEVGFGLSAFHTYAMEINGTDSVHLGFSLYGFMTWWLVIALVIFRIITVIRALIKKA